MFTTQKILDTKPVNVGCTSDSLNVVSISSSVTVMTPSYTVLDRLLMISMAELHNFNALCLPVFLGYFCEPTGNTTTLSPFSGTTICPFLFAGFFHLKKKPHIRKVYDLCSPLENPSP